MVWIYLMQCLLLIQSVSAVVMQSHEFDKDGHRRKPVEYTIATFKNFITNGFEHFGDDSSTTILIVVLICVLVIVAIILCCCCCACCAAAGMVVEAKKQ